MSRRYYSSSFVATTTVGSLLATDTTINVAALSGAPASVPWTGVLERGTSNEDLVTVTAVSGTTLTVVRGVDGQAAKSHASGVAFEHVASARDYDEPNSHVNSSTGVHGTTGAIVDTTTAQTLSNKTITQAQTHASPDTDAATTSLHHTIGTSATQAAAGNHTHSADVTAAVVATAQSTTSTSYVDLTTVGPAVTFTVPASGSVLVMLTATCLTSGVSALGYYMSVALSGANTLVASDANSASDYVPQSAGVNTTINSQVLLSGLTPGSTTFTAKYRMVGSATAGTFQARVLSVTAL